MRVRTWFAFVVCLLLCGIAEGQAAPPAAESPTPPAPGTVKIGGAVSPPVVLYAPEPRFSREERRKEFSGSVLIHLIVNEKGQPEQVTVVRGVGNGLDEKAIEAVRAYRFKPAMKDGLPVRVEMNVEVNFQVVKQPE